MDSATYVSNNQAAKDLVNVAQVHEACFGGVDHEHDCMVTLDAEMNGTSLECRKVFRGLISVPQLDIIVASKQDRHWKELYLDDQMRFVHPKQDICRDLPTLAHQFWTRGKNPRLWNFDLFSTFYTLPVQLVETIGKIPQVVLSKTTGTVLTFTFQAIPHGGILAKLKNASEWRDRIQFLKDMKNWTELKIMEYYQQEMDELWKKHLPSCVRIESVVFRTGDKKDHKIYSNGNALLYRGQSDHDSVMCVLMYRAWHDGTCTREHVFDVVQNARKRKMEQFEAEILESEAKRQRTVNDFTEKNDEEDLMEIDDDGELNAGFDSLDHETDSCEEDQKESEDFSSDASEDDTRCSLNGSVSDTELLSNDSGYRSAELDLAIPFDSPGQWKDMSDLQLFDHQMRMVEAVSDCPERGQIIAICGSGKSLPMVVCCKAVRISVIFVPFKILVEQFYEQYFKHDNTVTAYKVNSDNVEEICMPVMDRSTVYIANFDSAHRIAATGIEFDLVNWDEAHLATSDKRKAICGETVKELERIDAGKLKITSKKQIFWTATPNRMMTKYPEIYGHELFKYPFVQAVEDKIIKSFSLFISCYKDDHLEEESTQRKYEKIVEQSVKFIRDENCKRVLIYVNRVQDKEDELVSVENMRKTRRLFPREFKMEFLSAKTSPVQRKEIFGRFQNAKDHEVNVIVSCRTISVGVDLPNCDAVIFAATTKNAIEITQRGCRPCRLTKQERESGEYKSAKIFFPINTSAMEVQNFLHDGEKIERIHKCIRGNPLEIPMIVLDLLKQGLDVEYEFTLKDNGGDNDKNMEIERDTDEKKTDFPSTDGRIPVSFSFPYSDYVWKESEGEFAETMNHLCISLQKKPCPIDGWEEMSANERSTYVAEWSDSNDGTRPKLRGKGPKQKVMATWLGNILKRGQEGHQRCTGSDFVPLTRHAWWNEAAEALLSDKDPCPIDGWENMSTKERSTYVAEWSDSNDGMRPINAGGKRKDLKQKVMATWLRTILKRGQKGYERCTGSDFLSLSRHAWWNEAVEALLSEKERSPIDGWKDMSTNERSTYIAEWSEGNDGARPKQSGGNEKDRKQKVMATWLSHLLRRGQKGYERCSGPDFLPLTRHAWWNKAVEALLSDKRSCPIDGWEDMSTNERSTYIAEWSDSNGGAKPKQRGKGKDPTQNTMVIWLSHTLKRGQEGHQRCIGPDFLPLTRHDWWNEAVEALLSNKEPCAIDGWEDMSAIERSMYIAEWSDSNEGERPKQEGGKEKDAKQKVMATWLSHTLMRGQKGHQRCIGPDFLPLTKHAWWNEAVEALLSDKEPCAIDGWEDMSAIERSTYIAEWSDSNEGMRPKKAGKEKDAKQKVMATWIGTRLQRGEKGYQLCTAPDFLPLTRHAWWNNSVEALLSDKEPCAIDGWEDMSAYERSTYIAEWSDSNEGSRPKKTAKQKDAKQKVMATWIGTRLKRGHYQLCTGPDFLPLTRHLWWNQSVERLLNEGS